MRFIFSASQPERRIRNDAVLREAFQCYEKGSYRVGLDVIDAAMTATTRMSADHSWMRGVLYIMMGHESPSIAERAEAYRLAIAQYEEAVRCDCLFLLNFSPDLPESRWAVRSYPDLVSKCPKLYHRVLRSLRHCHFAPELALEVLGVRALKDLAQRDMISKVAYEGAFQALKGSLEQDKQQTYSLMSAIKDRVAR